MCQKASVKYLRTVWHEVSIKYYTVYRVLIIKDQCSTISYNKNAFWKIIFISLLIFTETLNTPSSWLNHLHQRTLRPDDPLLNVRVSRTIIAARNLHPGEGMCFGDSGGPLVCDVGAGEKRLVGLSSHVVFPKYSQKKCGTQYQDTYTRIAANDDFFAGRLHSIPFQLLNGKLQKWFRYLMNILKYSTKNNNQKIRSQERSQE